MSTHTRSGSVSRPPRTPVVSEPVAADPLSGAELTAVCRRAMRASMEGNNDVARPLIDRALDAAASDTTSMTDRRAACHMLAAISNCGTLARDASKPSRMTCDDRSRLISTIAEVAKPHGNLAFDDRLVVDAVSNIASRIVDGEQRTKSMCTLYVACHEQVDIPTRTTKDTAMTAFSKALNERAEPVAWDAIYDTAFRCAAQNGHVHISSVIASVVADR